MEEDDHSPHDVGENEEIENTYVPGLELRLIENVGFNPCEDDICPDWNLSFRCAQRVGYSGMGDAGPSSSAPPDEECGEARSHKKRPKTHPYIQECNLGDGTLPGDDKCVWDFDGSYNTFCGHHIPRNGICYQFPVIAYDNLNSSFFCKRGGSGSGLSQEESKVQMDLTDDLLHLVFSFIDHTSLCRAALVCRQWRAASSHEDFWRFLNFENKNISTEQFDEMCHRYPGATKLNISGVPAIQLLVLKAVSALRHLEVLILGKGHIGDAFFHRLSDCSFLRSLVVDETTVGNGVQEIAIFHDRLQHVEITKCRVLRLSVRCARLEALSLKRSNMTHAALNCPILRDLDIGSCHKLSDAAIRLATMSCPLLESLDLSNCSCVSDETLREIAQSCPSLHFLDASYCPNISFESVRLPLLTVLKVHSCEGITSASMNAISHSYMLEVLELVNCGLLGSMSLELPHLRNIRLVHCRKLSELNLRSLTLSCITVSNCPFLSRINIVSDSLRTLVLQKQESLATLALKCGALQEVDLSDCESLTDSICNVFSDGGGCPLLKTLVLDNCESLTSIRLCCISLRSLSLAGCRAVTAIDITCPYLEKICLDGCDHLERALFNQVGLKNLNLGICPKLNVLCLEAPHMTQLELKGCGVLSGASINCPLLTSLDASFCSQLKDDFLSAVSGSCPLIESLILMSCPSVGPDGLYSLRLLRNLAVLDLSYTFLMKLDPVLEFCFNLKVLKLQACKYLCHSALEPLYKNNALPSLQELDLSYAMICQYAIEKLLTCCTHLTHVSLNGCLNMHDLLWSSSGCRSSEIFTSDRFCVAEKASQPPDSLLQNLNCVGCPNINKILIPPPARCLHLLSLNLSLSVNLKEINIACLNLSFLNLGNCCSLEILVLNCPKLTSLLLQACNVDEAAVEASISQCNLLETLDVRFCPKFCSLSVSRLRAVCPSLRRIFSSLRP